MVASPARRFVGGSAAISAVREIAESIASRRSTVMMLGETGSGKEMLARHIHERSDRRSAPFIPVDCSALTDTLAESQLFGHVKGAFTGAMRDSLGFIRSAEGGTLFLDEIGEMSLPLQAKLLRVIQERQVVPVGDSKPREADVRIICATHRDLTQMVRDRLFREDLYFRLNVVVLHVPPLRERPDDVLLLANHFLQNQAAIYGESPKSLSDDATSALLNYNWPGNVRELANVIEHAHVLARGSQITLQDLPPRLVNLGGGTSSGGGELRLIDVERRTILEALRRTNGRKLAACRLLGINIQRLNRRMTKLSIRPAVG